MSSNNKIFDQFPSIFLIFSFLLCCGENQLQILDSGDSATEIENQPPDRPVLKIAPQAPGPDELLHCQLLSTPIDPDGDVVDVRFQWELNGGPTTEERDTISAELTSIGDRWSCIAISTDGELDSPPSMDSVEIISINEAPSQPMISIVPQNPAENHSLECVIIEESQDPNGDSLSYHYSWVIDGEISDEASSRLSSVDTEQGDSIVCEVFASDGVLLSEVVAAEVSIGEAIYGGDVTGEEGIIYSCSACSYCPDNDWYIAEKAFNNSYGTGADTWSVTWTGLPEWIAVDFGSGNEKTITQYGLMGASFHEGYRARDWEFQASNDEMTWDVLHSVVDANLPYVMYGGEPFTHYTLSNETLYRHYRIYVTANMGGQPFANELNIVEIEMMENGIPSGS